MERKEFRLNRELVGHQAGIECLALNADGDCLLSGDDDAIVIVWNLSTGEVTQKIECTYHGPISAILWITINDASEPVFVFGCADGSVHLYKKSLSSTKFDFVSMTFNHEGAIESLAFDSVHCRLASVGGGVPQICKISAAGTMTPILSSIESRSVVARSVFFCDDGASIVVCYLESHEIICFSIEPWGIKWSRPIQTRVGNSYLCSDDGLFLFITNLVNGVDQYRFPSLEKIQSFPHAIEVNCPLQISTVARGTLVICGGDNGFARVFDRRTGQLVQRLEHDKCRKQIPTITARSLATGSLVATGESGAGECKIRIWKQTSDPTMASISTRLCLNAKLGSRLTGMQAIVVGFIAMFCWHILVAAAKGFLDLGGVWMLKNVAWQIWKLASSFEASYYPLSSKAASRVSAEILPSTVVVTQTAFATVTSIITSTTLLETKNVIPSATSAIIVYSTLQPY